MTANDPEATADALRDLPSVAADVELLVQFGSTVAGRATKRSDVDIGVLCEGPADLDRLHVALAPRLGTGRLDLVDLRRVGPLLALEIARTGRVLFERRPGAFREFSSLAWRRYCDTAKLRVAARRGIQVFLERHGLA